MCTGTKVKKKFAEFPDSPRAPAWSIVRLITLPRNTLNVETSSNLFEWHFSKTNRKKLGWDEGNSSTEARTLSRHRRDFLWHFPQVFSQVKTQQICSPQIMRRRDGFIRQIQFHNILCFCHYSWSCRELSKYGQQELWIHPAKKERNIILCFGKRCFDLLRPRWQNASWLKSEIIHRRAGREAEDVSQISWNF